MNTVVGASSLLASLARRCAGGLWLLGWAVVVGYAHAPWRQLGGLVSENVRYWERVVGALAAICGCFVGAYARDAVRPGKGRTHATLIRYVLVIPAGMTATLLLFLFAREAHDLIGLVFVAFLAYWAGVDIAIGAWPLVCGRDYGFRRAINPLTDDDGSPELPEQTAGDPWR